MAEAARRAPESVAILLGIGFIAGGGAKINDPGRAVDLFSSWGVPTGGLIPLAGWVEVAIGVALLNRPTRAVAARALVGWMVLWGVIQIRASSPTALASGLVLALTTLYLVRQRKPWMPATPWIESPLASVPGLSFELPHRLLRLVGLAFLVRWAIGGTLYWCALPVLALADPASRRTGRGRLLEATLLHLLVMGLGVSGLWGFVGHTFMSETVARSVGWASSPFQKELAFYHLAIGVAGILCWWIRDHFWLAAAGIPSLFLYGAGWVHLADFLAHGNVAPTNWGFPVLFGNVVIPTVLLTLVVLRSLRPATALADKE